MRLLQAALSKEQRWWVVVVSFPKGTCTPNTSNDMPGSKPLKLNRKGRGEVGIFRGLASPLLHPPGILQPGNVFPHR